MIVLDIETSGLYANENGIWQIGAVDLYNPGNQFFHDGRIDAEDLVEEGALRITGKTEIELRDSAKQSQKELLDHFFNWCVKARLRNCGCENPQFDFGFLNLKARKYGLKMPLPHRVFDLHTLSQTKYFDIYGMFLIKDKKSWMDLANTLSFCGLEDNRGVHNGLEDAKLEAECFSRLWHGKNLFPEYSHFPVPDYLRSSK